nr:200 kDa antigen p200 [Tanacetum cinerariifolium]
MGKKKLEYDSPMEYDDEFIKAFKAQFHDKKYITITDLSKQIQRTTNTDFMFQMNYLMLFLNCMIHYDNSSRLIYYAIKNINSTDIISAFDWCKFIWDHIKTSKNTWDDRILENWYYGPNTVLMIGSVEVIKDDENKKDAEKRKIKELVYETIEEKFQNVLKEKTELEHLLKVYMEMDDLFSEDEKLTLYVKKFKEEFTKGLRKDKERAGTSGVGNDDEKEADKDSEMRQAAEKEAAEKVAAEKEVAAKEKEEAEKIAAAKKKEQAEKLAAATKKKAKKLAATKKKEQAKKLAAAKKKEEDEKLAVANKEQAEKLAATKKMEEAKRLAATKKGQAEKLAATKKKEAASKKKEEAEKKSAVEKEKAE